jgi:hypothetical protein
MPDKNNPKPKNAMEVLSHIGTKHRRAHTGLSELYIKRLYNCNYWGMLIYCFDFSGCAL